MSAPPPDKVFLPDTVVKPAAGVQDDSQIYKFWKVEDFFSGFDSFSLERPTTFTNGITGAYSPLGGPIRNCTLAQNDNLTLQVTLTDGSLLLIEVLRYDTFRIRWGPGKLTPSDYSQHLSRSIVMNTLNELRSELAESEGYQLGTDLVDLSSAQDSTGPRMEWSIQKDRAEWMKIVVTLRSFSIQAWRKVGKVAVPTLDSHSGEQKWALVWSTTDASDPKNPPLLCRKDLEGNYAICFSAVKRGRVMGFGEQGGLSLLKDKQQLNLYNFDNLAYSSVYNQQAINPSEPLYHSDPFGVELNGVAGYQSCIGLFSDSVSQQFFDLGARTDNVTRVGSRFADLEVHITCATDLEHACLTHSSCVGRGKLFPRYILGYHQGCYGYDSREKVIECAKKHRQYGIPLDGIHIDVDLQARYRTFTMNDKTFPNPRDMFNQLKQMGIKCSTNITPVISSEDNAGQDYWVPSSQARQQYKTLDQGLQRDVFVKERRWNSSNQQTYTFWVAGHEQSNPSNNVANVNDHITAYRGAVNYGGPLGTRGVYPDFGRREVRDWWGQQYADLFEAGLSMVWQDMTTPCIKEDMGDMKTFPFRLLLSDDSESGRERQGILTPAIKIHNLYSYNLHKATYKGLQLLESRKGLRNFIIGRGSFTGQHRFAGTWTGDNTSTWEFLRINVQQVISMGIGGSVITGADVGGFDVLDGSAWCNPVLLIRWTLSNSLLPWFRNHYNAKPGKKFFQEPYAYYENASRVPGQEQLYRSVLPICRYYITLRYTLMQLLYDTYFTSLHTGKPVARSLLHTDPWDLTLLDQNATFLAEEYMVGNDVLVAPVIYDEQQLEKLPSEAFDVYLPQGTAFYDFNLHLQPSFPDPLNTELSPHWQPLNAARAGGSRFGWKSSIDRYAEGDFGHLAYLLPIFVREGAILPTIASEAFACQLRPNSITMHFYPVQRADVPHSYELYLDDGVSAASAPAHLPQFRLDKLSGARSDYRQISFSQSGTTENGKKTRTLKMSLTHSKYDVKRVVGDIGPSLTLQIWHDQAEMSVAPYASITMSIQGKQEALAASYDTATNATTIRIPVDDTPLRIITITYAV